MPETTKSETPEVTQLTDAEIAKVAHEANRAYAATLGEVKLPWEETPKDVQNSVIAGVSYRRIHPWAGSEEQHDQWLEYKSAQGWQYGEKLDYAAKTHPCMLPYAKLPAAQRTKDTLFTAIFDALCLVS